MNEAKTRPTRPSMQILKSSAFSATVRAFFREYDANPALHPVETTLGPSSPEDLGGVRSENADISKLLANRPQPEPQDIHEYVPPQYRPEVQDSLQAQDWPQPTYEPLAWQQGHKLSFNEGQHAWPVSTKSELGKAIAEVNPEAPLGPKYNDDQPTLELHIPVVPLEATQAIADEVDEWSAADQPTMQLHAAGEEVAPDEVVALAHTLLTPEAGAMIQDPIASAFTGASSVEEVVMPPQAPISAPEESAEEEPTTPMEVVHIPPIAEPRTDLLPTTVGHQWVKRDTKVTDEQATNGVTGSLITAHEFGGKSTTTKGLASGILTRFIDSQLDRLPKARHWAVVAQDIRQVVEATYAKLVELRGANWPQVSLVTSTLLRETNGEDKMVITYTGPGIAVYTLNKGGFKRVTPVDSNSTVNELLDQIDDLNADRLTTNLYPKGPLPSGASAVERKQWDDHVNEGTKIVTALQDDFAALDGSKDTVAMRTRVAMVDVQPGDLVITLTGFACVPDAVLRSTAWTARFLHMDTNEQIDALFKARNTYVNPDGAVRFQWWPRLLRSVDRNRTPLFDRRALASAKGHSHVTVQKVQALPQEEVDLGDTMPALTTV